MKIGDLIYKKDIKKTRISNTTGNINRRSDIKIEHLI